MQNKVDLLLPLYTADGLEWDPVHKLEILTQKLPLGC